ncbi:biotin transporter BioY [Corynebacterium sp. UMB9976]|uniref:biotin transporter BioY n=1 Tax=Corynebacterium sp. UMB9976 TaxID=3046354 RepID=UPI003FA4202A
MFNDLLICPTMKTLNVRDLGAIVAFAALTIALGAVTIPVGFTGVPIVLQNMGVILTAMILGCLRGGLSISLFVGVGLVGVPNLAGWSPTISAISGPSIGYIVGYIFAAFIVGAISQAILGRRNRTDQPGQSWSSIVGLTIAGVIGMAVMYLFGSVGLMFRLGLDFPGALVSNTPFILPDLIKCVAAAVITFGVFRAVPHLVPAANLRSRN